MGNIIVCDNIYGDEASRRVFGGQSSTQQTNSSSQEQTSSVTSEPTLPVSKDEESWLKKTLPYILTGALGLTSGGLITSYLNEDKPEEIPAAAPVDADTQYILELLPE